MDLVGLVTLILVIALVGFLVWLIITYIPMPEPFPKVIIVIVAVILILYVLRLFIGEVPVLKR